jgi:HSP20 family protein
MNNLALWSPPSWSNLMRRQSPFAELDSWLRDVFGGNDWINADFSPAAEVARDGDDAVVRVELPGVDVDKDVNVEVENGQLVIRGERRDEHTEEKNYREQVTHRGIRWSPCGSTGFVASAAEC